jgi:hypothetical protein
MVTKNLEELKLKLAEKEDTLMETVLEKQILVEELKTLKETHTTQKGDLEEK